jgi:hypothetical protein
MRRATLIAIVAAAVLATPAGASTWLQLGVVDTQEALGNQQRFGNTLSMLGYATVVFGLLGVMNFAHGELFMMGAYAGIAVIGVTQSFWVVAITASAGWRTQRRKR